MSGIGKIMGVIAVVGLLATVGGGFAQSSGMLVVMTSLNDRKADGSAKSTVVDEKALEDAQKALEDARERIVSLRAKGVPVDRVAEAHEFLDEARRALRRNNMAVAKKAADSMEVYLARAEVYYRQESSVLGPKINAAKDAALKAREGLTGYQVRKIDSIVGVMDSFQRMDWLFKANASGQELTALLPILKEDEVKSARVKKLIPGEWIFTDKDKSVECHEVNAVMTKAFKFGTDGKVHLVEKKSGQSSCWLKEDWQFESWGTYDCKGDTIMLLINRFAAVKQMFKRLHNVDGKKVWKDENGPVYDSTITDGSQDRYVTFEDLKEDFRKVR